MHKAKKFVIAALIVSVLTSLSLGVAFIFGGDYLSSVERNLSSRLYHPRDVSSDILVVAIDEKSISDVSSGGIGRFGTWSRYFYANALNNIEKGNPSVVFFDLLFSTESQGLNESTLTDLATQYPSTSDFAAQIKQYMDTVHPDDQAFSDALGAYENDYLLKQFLEEVNDAEDANILFYDGFIDAIDLFSSVSSNVFTNVTTSEESTNSSMIFGIPRYYQQAGQNLKEQNADFQIAEHFLDHDLGDIPLQNGQMLINYVAKPYYWPTVSFSDVYNGRVPASVFEGKIVLIGTTASILQDRHFTPIDSTEPMPGIEIHASAIQTILENAYLQDQGGIDFVVQTVLSLTATVLVSLLAPLWLSGIFFFLMLILFPYYAQFRFDHGVVVQIITPLVSLFAAYVSVLLYRNFTEFAEKRKLKEAFGRYVSPELVTQISEHPELLKLGGERRAITALFLDIENFTNLSESLEPQAVVSVINTYFDALSKVIMSKGGTVDKFEGDAIMALFGAPVPSEDHGLKACETALAIREKMAELNASTGYKLNIRIGLATGDAIVGNMGSENRFDYTAMGDTVNTASRLEGANKFYSTRILVTEGTYEAAKGQFFMRQVDLVCLKGKDKAIRIYEILGPLSGATEEGHKIVVEWDKALEAYRAGRFDEAEKGFRAVLATLPDDGPSKTLLGRVATLKLTALKDWDGVWKFESK